MSEPMARRMALCIAETEIHNRFLHYGDKMIKFAQDFMTVWNENPPQNDFRVLPAIPLGNGFELSVQASRTHYCSPRETLENINEYKSFELRIYYNDEVFCPNEDARFKNEEWAKHFEVEQGIAGWVDTKTLMEIIASLIKKG